MSITKRDLFLGILAMDVYHVGSKVRPVDAKPEDPNGYLYNVKVEESIGLGVATRIAQYAHKEFGFFAEAFSWEGKTVIVYRGTDEGFVSSPDSRHGFGVGMGDPLAPQAQQAIDFYVAHAGPSPDNQNVIVTGQSLGGGLAGLVALLFRAESVVFSNMPFEPAATNAYKYSTSLLTTRLVNELTGEITEVANPAHEALRQKIYGAGEPWSPTSGKDRMRSYALEGEALSPARGLISKPSYEVSLDALGNLWQPSNPPYFLTNWIPGPVQEAGERHSSAPFLIRAFGDLSVADGGPKSEAWKGFMPHLWAGIFNVDVARAVGITKETHAAITDTESHWIMQVMLAYSAIDEGVRPFGDTAIRALYDDASDVGQFYNAGARDSVLSADGVKKALSKIIVQSAADQAESRNVVPEYQSGVATFDLASGNLDVQMRPEQWISTYGASGSRSIVGRDELFVLLGYDSWLRSPSEGRSQQVVSKALTQWSFGSAAGDPNETGAVNDLTSILLASGVNAGTLDATFTGTAYSGRPGGALIVGNDRVDNIKGSAGSDLIFTGNGAVNFVNVKAGSGYDLIIGGTGDDKLFVEDAVKSTDIGSIVFIGGGGKNTFDYSSVKDGIVVENGATIGSSRVETNAYTILHRNWTFQTDLLFDVDYLQGTLAPDVIKPKIDNLKDGPSDDQDGSGIDYFDAGGQEVPTEGVSEEEHGDLVDASDPTAQSGIVADFADPGRQFIADRAAPLPGDLGSLTGFPGDTFAAAAKIEQLIRIADAPDPLIDTYARDTRLDLANAESITATRYDDIIIGADAVYDWVTPPPPANAPPDAPPPAPEWKLDPNFGGYIIDAGDGDDVVMIRNGSIAQKLFDRIYGGKGDDVIFARGSLGGGIKGGAGNDVLLMRPKRTAAPRSRIRRPTDRC